MRAAAPMAGPPCASAHQAINPTLAAHSSGAASSRPREKRDRRRSTKPHKASTAMPTRPVREPDSVMPSTVNAIKASAAARCHRARPSGPISTSGTMATADHSSSVARWLGWRMLPTARRASAERAIHSPSTQCGMKTWITATALLASPAATQAAKKLSSSVRVGRRAAPPSTSAMVASSRPAADKPSAQGSVPTALDKNAADATRLSATCSAALRAAAARKLAWQAGARAISAAPHRPSAAAWLNRVGDGGTL